MNASGSRTAQSIRNAGISILAQIVVIVLGFATRTVFISELGVALLGVNTLLTSSLALLAIADLGINGAFMYALYKPLNCRDERKVATIINYARRLYRRIAIIVVLIGLVLLPFLDQLIHLDEQIDHLQVYYLIVLTNTAANYLMQDRLILLNADQKIHLIQFYSIIFTILRSITQIISLLIFESFIVFLTIQVFSTILNNLVIYVKVGRLYPYLSIFKLSKSINDQRAILRSTRALVIYRVAGLTLNNSVPLLISLIVGTLALGYYSNYMLIVTSVVMMTEVAFTALTPSVGNLFATKNHDAARRVFDEMVLVSTLIHGFSAVGFVALIDDFMMLWLGSDFVLPIEVVVAIVFNFYVTGSMMPLWSFRNATGLFQKTQFVMITTAMLSIALSLAFGPIVGMASIIVAPSLARLLTVAWYEPWHLIRDYLRGNALSYFGFHILAFTLWCLLAALVSVSDMFLSGASSTAIAVKVGVLVLIMPLCSWLVFRRTVGYRMLVSRVLAFAQLRATRIQKG